jgi:hypothetical protein
MLNTFVSYAMKLDPDAASLPPVVEGGATVDPA